MIRNLVIASLLLSLASCSGGRDRRPPHWEYSQAPVIYEERCDPCDDSCWRWPDLCNCFNFKCGSTGKTRRTKSSSTSSSSQESPKTENNSKRSKKRRSAGSKTKPKEIHCDSAKIFDRNYEEVEGPLITEVLYEYAAELRIDKNLHLEDSCVREEDGRHYIRLDFSSQDILDLPDARYLLVDLVEGFLNKLNDDGDVIEENDGRSFNSKDLEIYIEFESFFTAYVDLDYVAFVSLRAGLSHFYAGDSREANPTCWHKHGETYLQSLHITNASRRGERLYQEKNPIPKSAFDREFLFEREQMKDKALVPFEGVID